jgi:hypothetical protein
MSKRHQRTFSCFSSTDELVSPYMYSNVCATVHGQMHVLNFFLIFSFSHADGVTVYTWHIPWCLVARRIILLGWTHLLCQHFTSRHFLSPWRPVVVVCLASTILPWTWLWSRSLLFRLGSQQDSLVARAFQHAPSRLLWLKDLLQAPFGCSQKIQLCPRSRKQGSASDGRIPLANRQRLRLRLVTRKWIKFLKSRRFKKRSQFRFADLW